MISYRKFSIHSHIHTISHFLNISKCLIFRYICRIERVSRRDSKQKKKQKNRKITLFLVKSDLTSFFVCTYYTSIRPLFVSPPSVLRLHIRPLCKTRLARCWATSRWSTRCWRGGTRTSATAGSGIACPWTPRSTCGEWRYVGVSMKKEGSPK